MNNIEKLFPRDVYGRIALDISAMVMLPFSCLLMFSQSPKRIPADLREWIARVLVLEVGPALFLFFGCALIWAVATPRWLEHFLERLKRRLVKALLFLMLQLCFDVVWLLVKKFLVG